MQQTSSRIYNPALIRFEHHHAVPSAFLGTSMESTRHGGVAKIRMLWGKLYLNLQA